MPEAGKGTDDAATLRPCPFCGQPAGTDHTSCVGLFKEVMRPPSSSRGLDALPPEVEACANDPSRKLNHYVLVRELGRGGMGTVWKAWDLKLTRWTAIKFLDAPTSHDLARFEREAKLAARLRHPNIAAVYEFGEAPSLAPGRPLVRYLAMEYVDGQTLATAELPLHEWADLFSKVARAVDAAHQDGIVHRDLKPTNVMITARKWPYVMDFGLAKSLLLDTSISGTGVVVGTPAFMAPEQARGQHDDVDAQSDVYSLGASLYSVLCKTQPYSGQSAIDVLMQVSTKDPEPPRKLNPSIPADLETIVLKAMAKEKRDRYPSAAALAEDLERFVASVPVAARLPSTITLAARKAKRKALPIALVAAVAAAAALGVWGLRPDPPAPPLQTPQPPPEPARDPVAAITPAWYGAVTGHKFATACKLLEDATDLPESNRKELRLQTETAYRTYLDDRLPELERLLEGVRSERELAELVSDTALKLDVVEAIPVAHPVLDWARTRAKDGALAMAAAAVPLVEQGPNPWFLATTSIGAKALAAEAQAKADAAQDAPSAERERLRKELDILQERWRAFTAALPPAFRGRHPVLQDHDRAIARPVSEFPRVLPELERLTISLERDPVAGLAATAAALEKLDAPKGIARESRRELYTRILTARILLALLGEKSEDEAVEGLQGIAAKLKRLEGPANPGEFGPRVAAVFRKLSLIP